MRIKLTANGESQTRILEYLEENASDVLVEKINAGKKTMDGCFKFIVECAKKQAKNGCACIEDSVVYGWATHYFEEDAIKEGEKVTEKIDKVVKPEKKETPDEKLKRLIKEDKKAEKKTDEMMKNQMTIFDFGFEG